MEKGFGYMFYPSAVELLSVKRQHVCTAMGFEVPRGGGVISLA